jgi:hypothetical protein
LAFGIDSDGDIVGQYFSGGRWHAFLASKDDDGVEGGGHF